MLEHVVALMVRDNMMKAGQRAEDILIFGEKVKKYLAERTPSGATDKQRREVADRFFTAICASNFRLISRVQARWCNVLDPVRSSTRLPYRPRELHYERRAVINSVSPTTAPKAVPTKAP